MVFLAKAALGLCGSLALAGAYVFHEGVIRVDVDTHAEQVTHVHVWVPATVVPVGLYFVPKRHLEEAAAQARPFLPVIRELSKEFQKYPNAELVDVRQKNGEHVRIAVRESRIYVDVVSDTENVHVSFPAETLSDVADRLESAAPGV
jgi:hypothetical protein